MIIIFIFDNLCIVWISVCHRKIEVKSVYSFRQRVESIEFVSPFLYTVQSPSHSFALYAATVTSCWVALCFKVLVLRATNQMAKATLVWCTLKMSLYCVCICISVGSRPQTLISVDRLVQSQVIIKYISLLIEIWDFCQYFILLWLLYGHCFLSHNDDCFFYRYHQIRLLCDNI